MGGSEYWEMPPERVRGSFQFLSDGAVAATATITTSSSVSSFSSSSLDSPPKTNYLEHRVTKMDTLAGVAIMYGVEVSDIKRLNGLTTDIQMFAHNSLKIPLPGRHPPSPCFSNCATANGTSRSQTPPRRPSNDVLNLLRSLELKTPPSKVTPAMSDLQAYYGLKPSTKSPIIEGTEMSTYQADNCCLDDELLRTEAPFSDPLPGRHRKTRSFVNGFVLETDKITEETAVLEASDSSEIEKSIRRRQKNDTSQSLGAPELLEDNIIGFSAKKGKGLATRPKLGSQTDLDMNRLNSVPNGDASLINGFVLVRKSSSTSNLQDSENSSSIWPTSMWTLKPEVLARPLFDGLPKPITVRKNKAALD